MKTIAQRVFDELQRSPCGINELAVRLHLGRPKVKSACGYLLGKQRIRFVAGKHTAPGRPSTSRYEVSVRHKVQRSWIQHIKPTGGGFEVNGKHFGSKQRMLAHREAFTEFGR